MSVFAAEDSPRLFIFACYGLSLIQKFFLKKPTLRWLGSIGADRTLRLERDVGDTRDVNSLRLTRRSLRQRSCVIDRVSERVGEALRARIERLNCEECRDLRFS